MLSLIIFEPIWWRYRYFGNGNYQQYQYADTHANFGINQGAQPIIGYNFGAQQFDRVKETVKTASLSATGVVILGFIF